MGLDLEFESMISVYSPLSSTWLAWSAAWHLMHRLDWSCWGAVRCPGEFDGYQVRTTWLRLRRTWMRSPSLNPFEIQMRVSVTPSLLSLQYLTPFLYFSILTAKYARVCVYFVPQTHSGDGWVHHDPIFIGRVFQAPFIFFAHCLVYISFDPSAVKEKGRETQMHFLSYLVAIW